MSLNIRSRSKVRGKYTKRQLLVAALKDNLELVRLLALAGEQMQIVIEKHELWDENKENFDLAKKYIDECCKIQDGAIYVIE